MFKSNKHLGLYGLELENVHSNNDKVRILACPKTVETCWLFKWVTF